MTILTNLQSKQNDWATTNELAVAHWQNKDGENSIETIRNWVRNNPDHYPSKLQLANYLTLSNRQDEAIVLWENIIETTPDNWPVLNNLAAALVGKTPEKALGYAERAYKLNPSSPSVELTLATALLANSRETDRAGKLAASVVKRFPDDVSAGILLARAMLMNGKTEEGRKILDELRSKNPSKTDSNQINELLGQTAR